MSFDLSKRYKLINTFILFVCFVSIYSIYAIFQGFEVYSNEFPFIVI